MHKILNIMLSRELGGIQQAFLDYSLAMRMEGVHVVEIVSIGAKIIDMMDGKSSKPYNLLNLGQYDIISSLYLRYIIWKEKPDLIIAHGNRAIKFCTATKIKLAGVAHNYSTKHLKQCDYVFALTEHLENYLLSQGFERTKIMRMPNMIKIEDNDTLAETPAKPPEYIPTIGSMGRFVKKKGFDIFLASLALLKAQNIQFKAVIGGSGEEESHLKQLCNKLNLANQVTFMGWVKEKEEFFSQIDIFCLSSTHEPFGIMLLEAMERKKPIVSTKSEGPSEIIEDGVSGILCGVSSADDLATALARVISDSGLATNLSENGYLRLLQKYDIKIVAKILRNHLEKIRHDI
ncbi:MAG: glycosyltransferase family 4 protein [Pseudomonadota bacterium]